MTFFRGLFFYSPPSEGTDYYPLTPPEGGAKENPIEKKAEQLKLRFSCRPLALLDRFAVRF